MKIGLMIVFIVCVLVISPMALIMTWTVTSPFVTNFIARPRLNPLWGSHLLVTYRFYAKPGLDLRELFTYDRIVLALLFLTIMTRREVHRTRYGRVDLPLLMLSGAVCMSAFFSNNFAHAIRMATDTFGLCYIAYFLGKNYLYEDRHFRKYLNGLLVLGVVLVAVSLAEYYTFSSGLLYRITGPFAYWETLGLVLTIVFFVALFKRCTGESKSKLVAGGYITLLALFGLCVFLTLTRTSMICLLAGLFFIVAKGRDVISKGAAMKYLSLAALLVVLIAANPVLVTDAHIYKTRFTLRTDAGRMTLYRAALRMFLRNPILGLGLGDFRDEQMDYLTPDEQASQGTRGTCHNSYLVIAAESGLVGLVPMILLVYFSFRMCLKYYDLAQDKAEKLWALTMGALTVAYFLSAVTFDQFFEPTIENKLFYMSLGVSVARYKRLPQRLGNRLTFTASLRRTD